MKSKDLILQELKTNLVEAFKSTDENAIAQAFTPFAEAIQANVMEEVKAYQASNDSSILTKRGVHQLTASEDKFYQTMVSNMVSSDPRQAFSTLPLAYPETIIDNVISDIKEAHPLLNAINFTNTTILTKMIVNAQGAQLAVWGAINSAITAEMSGAIGQIDLALCKLSAFMPISKDMLVLSASWIDAYVRGVLAESIALALEVAIVDGTGKDMPIGMNRSVADNVVVTGGVYPKKTAMVVANLNPLTFGAIAGKLASAPNGKQRPVSKILMLVNPTDYFTRVFPNTTIRALDGTYSYNVLPFPTEIIQSTAVVVGTAIFGLADKYFMGIGAGTLGGKVEYSDDFKWLDDQRVYLTKMYGNGKALDDNAFILADISTMTASELTVSVSNVVKTKEQA
ncbi:phage major capsid protein [Clostridium tagluense]|uniref:phage major capsid protein n=1 Tax=Clostridium tagluense TaxID=360422 RepID=UPI001CF20FDE|nr:phage major capsid protein [Clostridium tagluense]MCB2311612.1 phage major capsid protein [Clostridium tagluense]MCB2316336.1 phage major capsid protein [Clostridium tagluense]MCB2321280.1 phage major capsid protein [Clostridium tagluense]MCB2326205.1 phage major capsid protein [Clostridium tagluense]MCB2331016.1 phage major capsid protein [Clostridium tagluense]